jgi:predicted RNase H-like nuclease (RuvC/YqgF family)
METGIESTLQQTIEKLQVENNSLKAENEALTAVNEELTAKVEELSKEPSAGQPAEEKKPEIPKESFKVDKKEYRFITPVFVHKKQRVTAEAALKDKVLLAHLVKIKSGFIQEI